MKALTIIMILLLIPCVTAAPLVESGGTMKASVSGSTPTPNNGDGSSRGSGSSGNTVNVIRNETDEGANQGNPALANIGPIKKTERQEPEIIIEPVAEPEEEPEPVIVEIIEPVNDTNGTIAAELEATIGEEESFWNPLTIQLLLIGLGILLLIWWKRKKKKEEEEKEIEGAENIKSLRDGSAGNNVEGDTPQV